MCGIVGYIGDKEKKNVILSGLKELEYRGYDSAGMAVLQAQNLSYYKEIGKLGNLATKMSDLEFSGIGAAIGHTRWATHGKPTQINAHPHLGEYSCVIHNGIIENYKELKDELTQKGVNFISQTDTEVIVHLFEEYNKTAKTPFEAYEKTISRLRGAFATLLITKVAPDVVFFAKNAAPMIIAQNQDEIYFSSSDAPLIGYAKDAFYLDDGSYGYAKMGEIHVFDTRNHKEISPNFTPLPKDKGYAQKNGFRFFMEKEIYEQSQVISECIMGRAHGSGEINLDIEDEFLNGLDEITICACGTSYHAGMVAGYLLERIAKIRTNIVVASEFRYKEPFLNPNSLFVVISQSGETADTLEALKIAKKAGLKTLAICNVDNSSIVRASNRVILTRAGIEKGVASTKAFATQVICLWLLTLKFALVKNTISKTRLQDEIKAILAIPNVVNFSDELRQKIYRLSKHYMHGHGFFFIGRDIFYPLALEGALKLKEISYLHAEGYPAGEMKHGPIALADSGLYTIALMPSTILYEKTKSNVEELAARDAFITAISPIDFELADDFIKTPNFTHQMSEFFYMMVVLQLLALEISIRLGNDVDMPRNLAKSVTVE